MSKYYAVKQGRETGIFKTWDECQKQVKGFSGALFKSFPTKEEAEKYLKTEKSPIEDKSKIIFNEEIPQGNVAYTDGAYEKGGERKVLWMWNCPFLDGKKITHSFAGNTPDMLVMENVGGELEAVIWLFNYCKENNI